VLDSFDVLVDELMIASATGFSLHGVTCRVSKLTDASMILNEFNDIGDRIRFIVGVVFSSLSMGSSLFNNSMAVLLLLTLIVAVGLCSGKMR